MGLTHYLKMQALVGSDFPKYVIPLIDSAKKNIDIVVYDWRWYQDDPSHAVQQFNTALVRAVARGVQVRAVVNTPLLIKQLSDVGIWARQTKDKRTVHTKMMLVDRQKIVIGSHNYTRNAFGSNIETSIIAEIPEGQDRFAQFFENLFVI